MHLVTFGIWNYNLITGFKTGMRPADIGGYLLLQVPMNGVKWGDPEVSIVSLPLKATPYLGAWGA